MTAKVMNEISVSFTFSVVLHKLACFKCLYLRLAALKERNEKLNHQSDYKAGEVTLKQPKMLLGVTIH